MLAPSSWVSQSSMAMDESPLPSNQEVEAFNDKVDEVTALIAGLQAGTIPPEYIDRRQAKKDAAAAKQREQEQAKKAAADSAGADPERQMRLKEKVEEIRASLARKQAARARYQEHMAAQGSALRPGTDYTKWDLFTPEDEEDEMVNSLTPNGPGIRALEKDIDERHQRLVEQRQLAERQRVRGNDLFKQKRFSEAYQCYEIGLDAERHSMTLHANAAMASLKLQCWIQAIEHCDKVLHVAEFLHNRPKDPLCAKALQRRAVARKALGHFSEAVSDLNAALAIEPANKELGSQLQQAELALAEHKLSASVQAKLGSAAQNQGPTRRKSGAPQSASSQPAQAKASASQGGKEGEVGGIRAVHAASLQPAAATGSANSSSKLGAVADACKRLQAAAHQAEVFVQQAGLAGRLPSPAARTLKDLRFLAKAVSEEPQETAMAVATCGGIEAAFQVGPKDEQLSGAAAKLLRQLARGGVGRMVVEAGAITAACQAIASTAAVLTQLDWLQLLAELAASTATCELVCKQLAQKPAAPTGKGRPPVRVQAATWELALLMQCALESAEDSRGLQAAALVLLGELAQHATIRAAMQTAACGGQPLARLAVSVVQSQDADVSTAALQLVQRMCASRRLLQEVCRAEGALSALLDMFCLYGNASTRKIASPAQQRSAAAILINMLLEDDVAAAAMAMPTVEGLGSMMGKGAEAADQAATVMLSRLAKQPSAVQRMHACGALPRLQNVLSAQLIRQTGQRQDLLVDPHRVQDALSSLFARVIQSTAVPASQLLKWGTVDSMLTLMRKSGSTDVTIGSAALFLSEAAQQLENVSCLHQAGAVAALLDVVKAEKGAASRNAGIALARMAKHPGCLQQLKEMQGLEILRCTVRP